MLLFCLLPILVRFFVDCLTEYHSVSVYCPYEVEETTVTQQVSHNLIKCQSRLLAWSHQRCTEEVNGSHYGYTPPKSQQQNPRD